jgi:hypothetical protein
MNKKIGEDRLLHQAASTIYHCFTQTEILERAIVLTVTVSSFHSLSSKTNFEQSIIFKLVKCLNYRCLVV